jgi:hypothetical protein
MINETYTTDSGIEHVIVRNEDGSITSHVKSVYDEQQAALSTPIVSSDGD